MNMDNRRRNPSHYNNRHRKRRKRKISPLEYPSMLVKWMIKNKAMSAVLGVLLAVVIDKQENHRRLRNRCLKMPTLR